MLCRLPERLQEVGAGREGHWWAGLGWGLVFTGYNPPPYIQTFLVRKNSPHPAMQSNNAPVVFFSSLRLLPHLPSKTPDTTSRFYKGFITRNIADFREMRKRRNALKWPAPQYVFPSL